MKAHESVENYDSRIREYANYSYRQSRNICKNIGKREAGSDEEKQLQEYVKNELASCADEVFEEEFAFQKDTKIIQNKIGAIFFICAAALVICSALLNAAVLSVCSIFAVIVGIFLSFTGEIYAPKKLSSKNVYAIKKPSSATQKRILFLSNPDCVRTTKLDSPFLKAMCIFSGIITAAIGAVIVFMPQFAKGKIPVFAIIVAVMTIFDVIALFSSYTGVLDGANKNLSGIFTSIAVLKYLKDMSISMTSTEIVIAVTGAHEAGISGAKYFVKNHPELLEGSTQVVCLDCLREEKNLRIEADKSNKEFAEKIKLSAKTAGVEMEIKDEGFSSDVSAFKKSQAACCVITASDENFRTQEDTYEDMKIKTIESTLKTIMQETFSLDESC